MFHPRFGEITEQPPVLTTGHAKELARWNAPKRQGGENANGFEPYPRMLYKAQQNPVNGKFQVVLDRDVLSVDKTLVILSKEQFDTSCQMIVGNPEEHDRAREAGWRDSQAEAVEYHESELDRLGLEAAHRNYDDRNMSPAAQREIEAAVAESGLSHVPEVKAKRAYRRKPKAEAPAA